MKKLSKYPFCCCYFLKHYTESDFKLLKGFADAEWESVFSKFELHNQAFKSTFVAQISFRPFFGCDRLVNSCFSSLGKLWLCLMQYILLIWIPCIISGITCSRSIESSVISGQSSICKLARSTTKVPPGVPRGVCLLNLSKYQNDSCQCLFKC